MLARGLVYFTIYINLVQGLVIPNIQTIFSFDKSTVKTIPEDDQLQEIESHMAPILYADPASGANVIPNNYIIVYKEGLNAEERMIHQTWIQEKYDFLVASDDSNSKLDFFNFGNDDKNRDIFSGYFGYFPESLLQLIQLDPAIQYIEPDSTLNIWNYVVQENATWGLAAGSHREPHPKQEYHYDDQGGKGVVAYVVDTGIKIEHEDFEGRARWGKALVAPYQEKDFFGHGTHCAGIIGSKTFGIAKQVELVAVGVTRPDAFVTVSDTIKGFEFTVADFRKNLERKKKGFKGSTVNVSIGGDDSKALDASANALSKAGLHVSLAAGNAADEASKFSPGRASEPITVGASDVNNTMAWFSNFGKGVDIFAPGLDIESTFNEGFSEVMSGTSMAAPHVTGLLSYFLSLQPELESEYSTKLLLPKELKNRVLKYATKGVLNGLKSDSPNLLAFNGAGGNLDEFWK
ncbi:peptidase S8/S53 domain-containing protein [Scheffersomyces coipomensis]|uniref:peptidase S8/S53 domain-containing protein n=1 Tax=Scheffersomyces coipomensis TaxID=1788519 RepID=UPI00315DC2CE